MTALYFFVGWWLVGVASLIIGAMLFEDRVTRMDLLKGAGIALLGPLVAVILLVVVVHEIWLPRLRYPEWLDEWLDKVVWSRKAPKP